ncbi:MAG: LacI family transcriptional regulator [Betaproteobacteria bacterium]|nr:MAG: LacI family transcriptional regulator [Betaproteobacteria bacterium]
MKPSLANFARAIGAATVLAGALAATPALAQSYPSKPVKVIVPFAAGGAVDTVARVVGQKVSEQIGQPVVVENKPGGHANIGADYVAKSAPDGYTALLGANGLAANMTLHKNIPFDTLRDFAPVAGVGYAPLVFVVPASSPAKTLQEFIKLAQAKPGSMTYGTAAAGGSGHLATELLKSEARFDALHVPYKGGAPALTDLIGDRINFMLINPIEAAPHVKSGKLRALAVSSTKRLAMLADVPTFKEAGVPGFEASVWWGFVVPAKTPKENVAKLEAEILKALGDPGVHEKLESLGAVVEPTDAAAFGKFLKSEIDKWARVIKAAKIEE